MQVRSGTVKPSHVDCLLRLVSSEFKWKYGIQCDAGMFIRRILETDFNQALSEIGISTEFRIEVKCRGPLCDNQEIDTFHAVTVSDLNDGDDIIALLRRSIFKHTDRAGRMCQKCGLAMERNYSFISLPDLLVIYLVRAQQRVKSTKLVSISNPLWFERQRYTFKTAVVHRGRGCGAGHYVAFGAMNSDDGPIALYDDSKTEILRCPLEKFIPEVGRNAVTLMFRKQE